MIWSWFEFDLLKLLMPLFLTFILLFYTELITLIKMFITIFQSHINVSFLVDY